MKEVIISTILIMGGAFIIGFAVAYLIKIITATLNYFEGFSLTKSIAVRKRKSRIDKIRRYNINNTWENIQFKSQNPMLDYYYPYKTIKTEENTY